MPKNPQLRGYSIALTREQLNRLLWTGDLTYATNANAEGKCECQDCNPFNNVLNFGGVPQDVDEAALMEYYAEIGRNAQAEGAGQQLAAGLILDAQDAEYTEALVSQLPRGSGARREWLRRFGVGTEAKVIQAEEQAKVKAGEPTDPASQIVAALREAIATNIMDREARKELTAIVNDLAKLADER